MRKIFIISLILGLLSSAIVTNAQIEVATNGNVGIKNTPSPDYNLYIHGNARATSSFTANTLNANYCNLEYLSIDGDYNFVTVAEFDGDTDYEPVVKITGESWMDYALRVDHNIRCSNLYQSSDLSLKTDIQSLNSGEILSKLRLINGKKYKLKSDEELASRIATRNPEIKTEETVNKEYYGLIAQDLEELFPELVKTSSDGIKAVNYSGMIPLLLEAIKEQQSSIENLQAEIYSLQQSELKSQLLPEKDEGLTDQTTSISNMQDEIDSLKLQIIDLKKTSSVIE